MSSDVSFPLYSSVSLPATGPKVNELLCQKAIVPRAVVLLRANQPSFKVSQMSPTPWTSPNGLGVQISDKLVCNIVMLKERLCPYFKIAWG